MLRSALALLSSLQIGVRIKQSVERSLRQAAVIAAAIVLLIAAAAFGLLAAYHGLVSSYQFSEAEAACIIAGALLLLGLLILALVPLLGLKQSKQASPAMSAGPVEGIATIDQQLGKAMQQVGPITLIAIAFVAGLLASRRR
jgi:membrane protease YdiL (CAAX protease family)